MIKTIYGSNPASVFCWRGRRSGEPLVPALRRRLFHHRVRRFSVRALAWLGGAEGRAFPLSFPQRVYAHRSAIADYYFFVVNKLIFALALGPCRRQRIRERCDERAPWLCHSFPELPMPAWAGILAATLAWALAMDFGL
jgi:hypothetical protein